MSEALDRVVEALAGVSEEEVAAALTAVSLPRSRPPVPSVPSRTPLPLAILKFADLAVADPAPVQQVVLVEPDAVVLGGAGRLDRHRHVD
ncbi:hypothetical protein ABT404_07115 [Streptomyces hyaluromycini]|uniref:Uncharacterized protein n=1 Tax=Streptomyces hyaluromycini TaxID=1377993 RepID=A0ABV1WSH4_9ACTN